MTTVIAEPGACHDGHRDRMLSILESAVVYGADVFKPQFWSDSDLLADRRAASLSYREIYRRYQMPVSWWPALQKASRGVIRLAATIYLPKDAAVIAPFVEFFKVASFEAMDPDLIAAIRETSRPLVVSTGMCDADDVAIIRRRLDRAGLVYQLLHCVSAYPAPLADCHLGTMRANHLHGFSDHTDPSVLISGAIAVGAGASIVEAHLRDVATENDNPDAPHAMLPWQFSAYVAFIRQADELMGGSPIKQAQPSERAMSAYRVKGPQ